LNSALDEMDPPPESYLHIFIRNLRC